jgi:hypothetical protein
MDAKIRAGLREVLAPLSAAPETDPTRLPINALSYDEALSLLERAEQLEEFVAGLGKDAANSWAARGARHTAKTLRDQAAACASLAVADELRALRWLLAERLEVQA